MTKALLYCLAGLARPAIAQLEPSSITPLTLDAAIERSLIYEPLKGGRAA